MSYILDALRKAEQERHLGQPPALTTAPPPAEPARHWFWYGLTVLGLGLNAMLLVFFLDRSQPAPQPSPAFAPSAGISAPGAASPAARPTPPAIQQPVTPPEPSRPPAPARPESKPPPAAASPTVSSPEPVPTLDALPTSVRRGLPALNLDIHVHSRDADKRFAVINGRRYREGEALSEGPILEAVTTAGVTLRRGNQRFQLLLRR